MNLKEIPHYDTTVDKTHVFNGRFIPVMRGKVRGVGSEG